MGGIFNTATTCIVSGVVLGKLNSIDWFTFPCLLNENFTDVTYVACGSVYVALLIHAIRILFKCCSSVEENFSIVLVSSFIIIMGRRV